MLDKNDLVRDTIRMFLSEVQRFEIDNKEEVDDAKVLQIINKMIKQRNDSISQFKEGGREDLADKEQQEVEILSKYKKIMAKLHPDRNDTDTTKLAQMVSEAKETILKNDFS